MMKYVSKKTPRSYPCHPYNWRTSFSQRAGGEAPFGKEYMESMRKEDPLLFELRVRRPIDSAIRQINAQTGCNYKLVEFLRSAFGSSPQVPLTFTAVDGDDVTTVQTIHARVMVPHGPYDKEEPLELCEWERINEADLFPLEDFPTLQDDSRHALEVYVGGLPPTANYLSLMNVFNQAMASIGGTIRAGNPVVDVYINHAKKFAVVEMRFVREASNAMALDGRLIFEGVPLTVRRPIDYRPATPSRDSDFPNPNLNLAAIAKIQSSCTRRSPDCIFVGGLPYFFTEAQTRELLEGFGALREFKPIKDRETGNSKGYAFCAYQDSSVTDLACAGLNGLRLGDRTLTVRRANRGQTC